MKPILFNTEMVRAILEGRKTVTRRVVRDVPAIDDAEPFESWGGEWYFIQKANSRVYDIRNQYKGRDILYVPEPWKCLGTFGDTGYVVCFKDGQTVTFMFSDKYRAWKWAKYANKPFEHWQSPYFMPREAARIFLRVKDVRVERLQEITEDGAIAEGVKPSGGNFALDDFEPLWDSTIKPADRALYGWEANPWVWVIEFERISKEEVRHDD